MNKPTKPKEPSPRDFPFDPNPNEHSPFIVAYRKYQKDKEKYEQDLDLYEQNKFIEDIKRSSTKLCLKKYRINLNFKQ